MFNNISIIGDGAMGTVLATMLCEKGINVRIWGYDKDQLLEIEKAKQNVKFLPGYELPDSLVFEPDDSKITNNADLIVSAVPCQFMRSVWKRLRPYIDLNIPIVTVAKGIENETLLRPDEILKDILGNEIKIAALSGPTIADELARKLPATAAVACIDNKLAKKIQHTFTSPYFRVYTNSDIIGVELSGALKNVIAIAAGIIDGIKAGDNAKAALISRGLAEIARLGETMGANLQTFAGLTGLGDLVTTCISPKGRNRTFGQRIGRGMSLDEALSATNSVVEGVTTCKSVCALAQRYNIEMPITKAVYQIIFERKAVQDAINELMQRKLKPE